MAMTPPSQSAPQSGDRTAADAPGSAWLVCRGCGADVVFESCHTRCPRCHTLVESCSDGGRMSSPAEDHR